MIQNLLLTALRNLKKNKFFSLLNILGLAVGMAVFLLIAQYASIFIEHGANVNAIDEEFYSTPLGYAAKYGKKEMVELLLKNGADPNLPEDPSCKNQSK